MTDDTSCISPLSIARDQLTALGWSVGVGFALEFNSSNTETGRWSERFKGWC